MAGPRTPGSVLCPFPQGVEARSRAARRVGGTRGPAPLAALAGASPAAHRASGTPFCSALGWVFRSADRTNAPLPCGLTYGGVLCPSPQGIVARSSAARQVGGTRGPAPLAAVAEPPPTAHPASGIPFCSALGWVFWSADRTNAPPPCGLTYGGCPLPLPRWGVTVRSSTVHQLGGGGPGPRPSGGRCRVLPRGIPCIGRPLS